MKLYTCDECHNLLYFENNICLKCGHALGFDAQQLDLITLKTDGYGVFTDVLKNVPYRFCTNAVYATCNWLIPMQDNAVYCLACQLNRIIPTLTSQNLEHWKRIETAKHRLVYSLLRLNLPLHAKLTDSDSGVAFDFLADVSQENHVLTGHDNGVITLNIEEADEAERVRNKLDLGEKYRTLLGHFRHEIGHYYWDVLIRDQSRQKQFRSFFGNENADYGDALKTYYANGAPHNWSDHFISPYATAHPWEDWAESWAHYLHMMDTLETAYYFGLSIHPELRTGVGNLEIEVNHDPYTINDFNHVFKAWLPLTFAVNSLNRSMGHADFYPFVVPANVIEKLQFIHQVCREVN